MREGGPVMKPDRPGTVHKAVPIDIRMLIDIK